MEINIQLLKAIGKFLENFSDQSIYKMIKMLLPTFKLLGMVETKILKNNLKATNSFTTEQIKDYARSGAELTLAQQLLSLKYLFNENDLFPDIEYESNTDIKELIKDGAVIVIPHVGLISPLIKPIARDFNKEIVVPIRARDSWSREYKENLYTEMGSDQWAIPVLGGSLSEIERVINNKGVVILALDAILPTKYLTEIDFLNQKFKMSTGALFIARNHNLPLLTGSTLFNFETYKSKVVIAEAINYPETGGETEITQEIANRLSKDILNYPEQWHIHDELFPS